MTLSPCLEFIQESNKRGDAYIRRVHVNLFGFEEVNNNVPIWVIKARICYKLQWNEPGIKSQSFMQNFRAVMTFGNTLSMCGVDATLASLERCRVMAGARGERVLRRITRETDAEVIRAETTSPETRLARKLETRLERKIRRAQEKIERLQSMI